MHEISFPLSHIFILFIYKTHKLNFTFDRRDTSIIYRRPLDKVDINNLIKKEYLDKNCGTPWHFFFLIHQITQNFQHAKIKYMKEDMEI